MAGAGARFAPGLSDLATVRALCEVERESMKLTAELWQQVGFRHLDRPMTAAGLYETMQA